MRCRRPGAALTFRLQCAFQAATKRVFIHASEIDSRGEPVKDNMQIMGLQLPNYVPAGDQCATSSSSSWDGGWVQAWQLSGGLRGWHLRDGCSDCVLAVCCRHPQL